MENQLSGDEEQAFRLMSDMRRAMAALTSEMNEVNFLVRQGASDGLVEDVRKRAHVHLDTYLDAVSLGSKMNFVLTHDSELPES